MAAQGRVPYKSLVTHGFVLDTAGRKMSKSLGNVIDPATIVIGGKVRIQRRPASFFRARAYVVGCCPHSGRKTMARLRRRCAAPVDGVDRVLHRHYPRARHRRSVPPPSHSP